MSKPSRLRAAVTAGRLMGRRLLRRQESERDTELGELLTGQLDEMKGLAMKLGQIVSYMDVPLPDSVQEKLARLQRGVVGLGPEETRRALAAALGPEFEQRLEQFDVTPIAAASIGQVHRATFRGRAVALKLRYPDISGSFRKDLGTVERIASLASLASAVDGRAIVRELADRLEEECDYVREAVYQRRFGDAYCNDPHIVIPEVIDELSTADTLATQWIDGADFQAACLHGQAQRDRYAETLLRFSYHSLFVLAAIQADPHPGNFLFGPGDTVAFLDFGCVRTFDPEQVELLRELVQTIEHNDRPRFRDVVIALKMAPRPRAFNFDHHFQMMEHLHRPLLQPSFEFSRDYVQQGLAYNGPTSPNARHLDMPPAYVWVARLQWGLWSLLTRLHATVRGRDTLDAILGRRIQPL